MDFLKEILGETLFEQVFKAINEYNGNEANKDKQVKIGNLASGEYVGKGKYDALQKEFDSRGTELLNANNLIEDLKKTGKNDKAMQTKIGEYETAVENLKKQLDEAKLKSAVKVALMSEKAVDVDYLTYKLNEKLKEKGESLELDENENIKGWKNTVSALKTQFPNMFENASDDNGDGYQRVDNGQLDHGKNDGSYTRKDILKMPYSERLKVFNEEPEAYQEAMNTK